MRVGERARVRSGKKFKNGIPAAQPSEVDEFRVQRERVKAVQISGERGPSARRIEGNVGKRKQVGCRSGVCCPSTSIHAKVGSRPPLCHPESLRLFDLFVFFALDQMFFKSLQKGVILSEAPRRSIA